MALERLVPHNMRNAFRQSNDRAEVREDCEDRLQRLRTHGGTNALATNMAENQLRILYRVSCSVTGIRNLDQLLETTVRLLCNAIDFERAQVFLREEETGALVFSGASERGCFVQRNPEWAFMKIVKDVCDRRKPFVSSDPSIDPRLSKEGVSGNGAVMCAPLKVGERVLGALYVDRTDRLESIDESTISLFAAYSHLSSLAIENALVHEQLLSEKLELQETRNLESEYPEIVGRSEAVKHLLQQVSLAASSPMDILITGESGTGKELIARALHQTGRRAAQPFVAVDCGSLSESIAESEFFGYRRGAFTGAFENRMGLLEAAEGGVVFLDEVGNLTGGLQGKLLRVLQEREIRRLGETRSRKLNVQVLAATNRNLRIAAKKGEFRQDLFYRLNAIEIWVPPLRERSEDIPLLIEHFSRQVARTEQGQAKRFSKEALELLCRYPYPGNIRELENAVRRSYYFCSGSMMKSALLPDEIKEVSSGTDESPRLRDPAWMYRRLVRREGTFEEIVKEPFLKREIDSSCVRETIRIALKEAKGRYRGAFKLIGVADADYSRTLVFLKRHGCYLDFREFRDSRSASR